MQLSKMRLYPVIIFYSGLSEKRLSELGATPTTTTTITLKARSAMLAIKNLEYLKKISPSQKASRTLMISTILSCM